MSKSRGRVLCVWVPCLTGLAMLTGASGPGVVDDSTQVERGRELFLREWVVNDPRGHGGDGLGPVFNDSSCVACHNAGGTGGGGPVSKNVNIITASANPFAFAEVREVLSMPATTAPIPEPGFAAKSMTALFGVEPSRGFVPRVTATAPPPTSRAVATKPDRSELVRRHAGFKSADSVVLHHYGTEEGYESWRNGMLGFGETSGNSGGPENASIVLMQVKNQQQMRRNGGIGNQQVAMFNLVRSQRNPTSLFGAGQIDAIPEAAIEAYSKLRNPEFPEIEGRVARLKDGRIGRFGWKAQTASLADFTMTACAVELGLEVPDHSQGGLPQNPDYLPGGLDLSASECDDLTAFIRDLPRPTRLNADLPEVAAGSEVFERIGCATCHAAKLGEVSGLYSDLLLHDLGPKLGDVGQYEVFAPGTSEEEGEDEPAPIEPAGPIADREGNVEVIEVATSETITIDANLADIAIVDGSVPFPQPIFNNQFGMGGTGAPRPKLGAAGRQEWKTPPLWGLRDSGPYLHDGRADTIDEAIALHGGESSRIALNYFSLTPAERRQMLSFLRSLAAPTELLTRSGE